MSTAAATSQSEKLEHDTEQDQSPSVKSYEASYRPHYRIEEDEVFTSSYPDSVSRRPESTNDDAFSFSEDDLIPNQTDWLSAQPDSNSYTNLDTNLARPALTSDTYKKPKDSQRDSRITVSRALLISEQKERDDVDEGPSRPDSSATPSPPRTRGLTRTLTNLGRKSKVPRNASRSPEKQQRTENASNELQRALMNNAIKSGVAADSDESATSNKRRSMPPGPESSKKTDKASRDTLHRSRSLLGRRQRTSSFGSYLKFSGSSSPPTAASPTARPSSPSQKDVSPLQKSFSNHNLPKLNTTARSRPSIPPLSRRGDGEGTRVRSRSPVQRKKDDFWGVFRTLDGDFQKFQSKSIAHKAHVVKSSLLPFLRTHAPYASTIRLRPEDLDRRVLILNKWWTALLALLAGHNNQTLSGTDRPIILEAISGILDRPEWRTPPSEFAPIFEARSSMRPSRSKTKESTTSGDSDFVLESVNHSIRNTFVQNLFSQIVIVVDKMSLRHAPASLVAFCGKSCAYAFFFCPGVAEMLVRLWDIQISDMLRIMTACGFSKTANLIELSDGMTRDFPHCLESLAFSSPRDMMKKLRGKPVLPLGIEKVQWYGYWLNRWSGRDSDLFTVFIKHFHMLATDFLPTNPSREERLCAPGLILVHAQILKNIDSTIHRQLNQAAADNTETSVTFEDFLGGDDNASALPAFPANAARLMAENRFIMLLREITSERNRPYPPACTFFTQGFCDILKASAKATSLFNHSSCFTLCDFIQECFPLIDKIQEDEPEEEEALLDWSFWLTVFRQMLQSQNTTTEIRLYAFLYTMWHTIATEDVWRMRLSCDLLLSRTHFISTFCHWCPMVRAYYMRLICWRIARHDGDTTADGHVETLQLLQSRLLEVWSHHKSLVAKAEADENLLPPSTAPCNPAPGRRLLIIRTDNPATAAMDSLNSIVPPTQPTTKYGVPPQSANPPESTMMSPAQLLEKVTATLEQGFDSTRRRGGMLRSLLGYKNPEPRPRSQSPKPASASEKTSPQGSRSSSRESSPNRTSSRSSMYESRPVRPSLQRNSTPNPLPPAPPPARPKPLPPPPTHTPAFFKFSLELVDRRPPMISELVLSPPRLPLAAQLFLETQPDFTNDMPASPPTGVAIGPSRYAGRALAEWTLIVNECQNFFERRRSEGVPSNRQVETPTLGVESFRKPG
ncbi:MAG: hypothetical protein M1828_001840 [Chrysothrix sp. TS-e1954]|nr:MAG: hypothetical protein M1828_001840 [Chrysothrix sp. TS-e1954]